MKAEPMKPAPPVTKIDWNERTEAGSDEVDTRFLVLKEKAHRIVTASGALATGVRKEPLLRGVGRLRGGVRLDRLGGLL